jgi:hypothetical protein
MLLIFFLLKGGKPRGHCSYSSRPARPPEDRRRTRSENDELAKLALKACIVVVHVLNDTAHQLDVIAEAFYEATKSLPIEARSLHRAHPDVAPQIGKRGHEHIASDYQTGCSQKQCAGTGDLGQRQQCVFHHNLRLVSPLDVSAAPKEAPNRQTLRAGPIIGEVACLVLTDPSSWLWSG